MSTDALRSRKPGEMDEFGRPPAWPRTPRWARRRVRNVVQCCTFLIEGMRMMMTVYDVTEQIYDVLDDRCPVLRTSGRP